MKILALYENLQLKFESTNKKRKELKNQKNIPFYLLYSLKAQTLYFSILLIRILLLLFGDSSENYLIFTRLNQDSVLVCNNSFCVYKKFQKKVRFLSKTAFSLVVVSTIVTSSFLYFMMPGKPSSQAATNNWNQADWSLGADIVAVANHTDNQTGWQKFYSKDDNVLVGYGVDGGTAGQIKLSNATTTVTETLAADFNAGTNSNTGVSGDSVLLLKPNGAVCTGHSECLNDGCSSGVCSASQYVYTTQCTGIDIYYQDAPGAYTWYNRNNGCLDSGRAPTKTELACIYSNKASLGSFQSSYYWSSTESSSTYAWRQDFSAGGVYDSVKTFSHYIRCVRGQ